MVHPMTLKLTREGWLVWLAIQYTTQGARLESSLYEESFNDLIF